MSAILTAAAGVRDNAGSAELCTKILWKKCRIVFHKLNNKHSIGQKALCFIITKLFAFIKPYIFVPIKLIA
jgi:hypothetical protein